MIQHIATSATGVANLPDHTPPSNAIIIHTTSSLSNWQVTPVTNSGSALLWHLYDSNNKLVEKRYGNQPVFNLARLGGTKKLYVTAPGGWNNVTAFYPNTVALAITLFDYSVWSAPLWYLAGGAPAPVAAYQPKGAASQAASYVNLANPGTYDAAPGVAPTWSAATGWTFNGTTQYLTTGIVPSLNWTLIVRFSDVTNNGIVAGSGLSTAVFAIAPRRGAGGIVRYSYLTTIAEISPGMTAGTLALAGHNRYRDGVADGAFTASTVSAVKVLCIGCALNDVLDPAGFIAARVQYVAAYASILTANQVAAVSAAMAAL